MGRENWIGGKVEIAGWDRGPALNTIWVDDSPDALKRKGLCKWMCVCLSFLVISFPSLWMPLRLSFVWSAPLASEDDDDIPARWFPSLLLLVLLHTPAAIFSLNGMTKNPDHFPDSYLLLCRCCCCCCTRWNADRNRLSLVDILRISSWRRKEERERETRFFCVYYVFFFFLTDMRARHPAAPSQLAAGCDWISLSLPDADEWSIYLPPPARWIMNRKKGVVAQLPCNPSSIQSRPEAGRRMRTIVTMAIDYHYSFWRRRKKINRRRRFPSFRVDEPVKSVGDSALFLLNFLLFNLYSRGLVAAQDRGNRCSRFRDTCTSPRSVYCSVRDEHLPVASSAKKEKGRRRRRRRRHGWVGTTSSWPVRYLSWLYDDNLQKKIKYENASALRSSLHLNPI